jgi:hypothetical protein
MANRGEQYWRTSFEVNGSRPAEDGHECARGKYCAAAKNVEQPDGSILRVPGFTYQVFCQACTGKIVEVLTELPKSFAKLEAEYGSPVRRNDQAIRVPFGPSVPIRLDVDALQREAPPIIGGWAARVRSVPGLQLSPAEYSPYSPEGFAEACKVLRIHKDPLFSLQPFKMTRTFRMPVGKPGTEPQAPVAPEIVDQLGDREILHIGLDFVTVQVECDGATAGNEILDLQHHHAAVLNELRVKPQPLTGVPCRADGCGWMTLVRAEPPSNPDDPGYYSICTRCRDRLAEDDYKDWVALCAAYERNRRREPVTLENLPGVA